MELQSLSLVQSPTPPATSKVCIILTVKKLKFPGNFATTFVVSDSYDATTLSHYKVIPDGNSSIYSTQNLTFASPSSGSPQDIGVFQLSYYFAPV